MNPESRPVRTEFSAVRCRVLLGDGGNPEPLGEEKDYEAGAVRRAEPALPFQGSFRTQSLTQGSRARCGGLFYPGLCCFAAARLKSVHAGGRLYGSSKATRACGRFRGSSNSSHAGGRLYGSSRPASKRRRSRAQGEGRAAAEALGGRNVRKALKGRRSEFASGPG